jgi:AraC-like DNA-binding protein
MTDKKLRTARRRVSEPTVRIATAMAIPTVLSRLGFDAPTVLAEAGIDIHLFDNPDNEIPYSVRTRLINHCVARTGCRHFGLLIGQLVGLGSLGLVGLLVRYEPDLGTALKSLVRYIHLHVRGAAAALHVEGASTIFSYEFLGRRTDATDQTGDAAVAIMFNLAKELCGADWAPSDVWFAHRAPADARPFQRFFQAPIRFDADRYALVFPSRWLERPLPVQDPQLRGVLRERIDLLDATHGEHLPDQVRRVLRMTLPTNTGQVERIASLLSMHVRTLHRRLQEHGTSFRQLANETRCEVARQLLEETSLDLHAIADALGYADTTAFGRAFRRWTHTTPAGWRARHRDS